MKHTPAPWITKGIHVVMPDGYKFKQDTPRAEGQSCNTQLANQQRREANARLAAAAPELLEALEDYINNGHSKSLCERAKTIVAKAKGETP